MSKTLSYLLILLSLINFCSTKTCFDESPYCNTNDCTVRPGYALQYCKKTCGNCTEFCYDSQYINCSEERKKDCDAMLRDYCPQLCGVCVPRKKSIKRINTVPIATLPTNNKNSSTTKNTTFISDVTNSTPSRQVGDPYDIKLNFGKQPYAVKTNELKNLPFENKLIVEQDTLGSGDFYRPVDEFYGMPEPEPIPIMPHYPYSQPYELPIPQRIGPIRTAFNPSFGASSSMEVRRSPSSHSMAMLPYGSFQGNSGLIPSHAPPRLRPALLPAAEPAQAPNNESPLPLAISDLIAFLGCRDRDPLVCSKVTPETCLSRPGYYLKLCPVTCKNCNGLQCIDSIKIDCAEVEKHGGCKLGPAAEYCPRTCGLCPPPPGLADSLSPCKDELETCQHLAESGACQQSYSKAALRIYCAKSCGFCREPQFYHTDYPLATLKLKQPTNRRTPIGKYARHSV
ncbi:unnamed protein product [Caenorhabditis auriculariae]|uniref:ShKT domain-containing protein n=1 Tax=Caenorhabditis auriculariae TaxID=2777116 RepID=A0A8S1HT09_9PELO|nr:unnamed protein product [Caenorhabditis auriculariae]